MGAAVGQLVVFLTIRRGHRAILSHLNTSCCLALVTVPACNQAARVRFILIVDVLEFVLSRRCTIAQLVSAQLGRHM